MSRKGKFSALEKQSVVEDYLSGRKNISQICSAMQIHDRSFYSWLQKYQMFGAEGLATAKKNKHYPKTVKLQAVKDYLNGKASQDELCRQYGILAHSTLHQWIKKYNGYEAFKSHNSQGDKRMTKGRKTSYEEKIEIVSFCIANDDNYQAAADKFQVSYQQVYTWMKKYRSQGFESLTDLRGKRKAHDEMNESEKMAAQLKLLESENRRLKMENDFLKKLDEVERRRTTGEQIRNTDIKP